jgi:hypothetical protein
MSYDRWKATDPSDGERGERAPRQSATVPKCRDCGEVVTTGGSGSPYGVCCESCYRQRERISPLAIFDPRPLRQLIEAQRGAA